MRAGLSSKSTITTPGKAKATSTPVKSTTAAKPRASAKTTPKTPATGGGGGGRKRKTASADDDDDEVFTPTVPRSELKGLGNTAEDFASSGRRVKAARVGPVVKTEGGDGEESVTGGAAAEEDEAEIAGAGADADEGEGVEEEEMEP